MESNNNFEEKLYKYFRENREVPEYIKETINNTNLRKNKSNAINNIRKVAIAGISLVTLSTGFVFADDIVKFVSTLFASSEGVNTAVENGYIYQNQDIQSYKSSNTETHIQDIVMDDYTLDFNVFMEFDENIDLTGIDKYKMPDLLITDDMNNILYSADNEITKDFCNNNGIEYKYDIAINTSSSIFIANADKNYATVQFNLSASDEKFPKSKKIYISFKTIEMTGNNKDYTVTGDWKNEIDIPDKFVNRESRLYKVVNCNNENVYEDSIIAEVYETGMKFEMSMYWGDYESEHKRMEEMRKVNVLSSQLIKQEESYVENENGERFYPSQSSESDGGYSFNTDGKLHKWETFNLTKFNATEKLKVVLTTIDNEQIIINLQSK